MFCHKSLVFRSGNEKICEELVEVFVAMRTLFLIAPSSRKDQTDLGSGRDDKMSGSSLVGIILADRFSVEVSATNMPDPIKKVLKVK